MNGFEDYIEFKGFPVDTDRRKEFIFEEAPRLDPNEEFKEVIQIF